MKQNNFKLRKHTIKAHPDLGFALEWGLTIISALC